MCEVVCRVCFGFAFLGFFICLFAFVFVGDRVLLSCCVTLHSQFSWLHFVGFQCFFFFFFVVLFWRQFHTVVQPDLELTAALLSEP